jgi:hypothetical protein
MTGTIECCQVKTPEWPRRASRPIGRLRIDATAQPILHFNGCIAAVFLTSLFPSQVSDKTAASQVDDAADR